MVSIVLKTCLYAGLKHNIFILARIDRVKEVMGVSRFWTFNTHLLFKVSIRPKICFLGSGLVRGVDWPTHSVKYHSKPVIVGIERSYG